MGKFSENEKKLLIGKQASIARKLGCTTEYVNKVVNGKVKSDTELTRQILVKAKEIINIFN